jgi:hypothetical protein
VKDRRTQEEGKSAGNGEDGRGGSRAGDGEDGREGSELAAAGATKPPTPRPAAEGAEQARVLRVGGRGVLGLEVELAGVDLGLGFGVVRRPRRSWEG